ncbi:MAG TPA: hypothetical protein VL328_17150 [Gemmatimonadaceae bacterium]|jgi:hypothetical protein|nr:hypothetical protein [Gemmatimonadaceae bacterium]
MIAMKLGARLLVGAAVLVAAQGCAALSNVRVAPLPQENASSQRSMLSLFNPLPFQHRSVSDGWLLRAPEERSSPYVYIGY